MGSKQVTLYAPIVTSAPSDQEAALRKQLERRFEPRLEKSLEDKMHQRVTKDARHRTGIFFPDGYVPGPNLDLIVYFHGLLDRCGGSASDTVMEYWTNKYFKLRDWVNDGKKNVVLVVPRLVDADRTGSKLGMTGNDFLAKVAAVVAERVQTDPFSWSGGVKIRNVVLAAHSGGGTTMLRLAQTVTVARVCECWGFDSFYYWKPQEWVDWAAAGGQFFLFWHDEENTGNNVRNFNQLLTLKANTVAAKNVVVKYTADLTTTFPARTRDHCAVPNSYFPDLITRKGSCLT